MIVGGHVVDITCQRIRYIVIAYVYHQIEIFSSYRFSDDAFCFSGAKARYPRIDEVVISLISRKGNVVTVLMSALVTPFYKIVIHFGSHFLTSGESDQPECTYRNIL